MNSGIISFSEYIFDYLKPVGEIEDAIIKLVKERRVTYTKYKKGYLSSVDSFKDLEKIDKYLRIKGI